MKNVRDVAKQEKIEYNELLEFFNGGITVSDSRCWPSPADLAFFKAIQLVFPVTDFEHPIVSSAQLLLGQYISQSPIRGPRDVIACLCTCQIFLDFCEDAKRFTPEVFLAIEALTTQALNFNNHKTDQRSAYVVSKILQTSFNGERVSQLNWLREGLLKDLDIINDSTNENQKNILTTSMMSYKSQNTVTTNPECCNLILKSLLDLCEQLATIYSSLPSIDIHLERICSALNHCEFAKKTFDKLNLCINHCQSCRKPLQLLNIPAKFIKIMDPLFIENYKMVKDGHDPDKYRVEVKRLRKQANRERKGVARELRKDAQFIADHRMKNKMERMNELQSERIHNFNLLGQQAGEMNKAIREFGATGGGTSGADMRGRRK